MPKGKPVKEGKIFLQMNRGLMTKIQELWKRRRPHPTKFPRE